MFVITGGYQSLISIPSLPLNCLRSVANKFFLCFPHSRLEGDIELVLFLKVERISLEVQLARNVLKYSQGFRLQSHDFSRTLHASSSGQAEYSMIG